MQIIKRILTILAALTLSTYAAMAMAAVDVNTATAAELDAIKGIGPGISGKIVEERKQHGAFKDWNDFIARTKGIGDKNAKKFSEGGLTVGGAAMTGAAAKPSKDAKAAKTEAKADAKADAKAAKTEAKAEVKDSKADAKADAKAEKTDAKADAKAEKADKKADKKAAKADKKADAKAAASSGAH